MAPRQDVYIPLLAGLTTLRDPVPAQVSIPAEIANRHHTLVAGFGRPNQSRGMYLRATSNTTWTVPLRVPQGVTLMDATLLVWGRGTVTLTTSADATGSQLTGIGTTTTDPLELYTLSTAGPIDPSEGATSGRAFQAVAAESWDFQNVDVTFTVTVAGGDEFGLAEVIWRPVVQRRT